MTNNVVILEPGNSWFEKNDSANGLILRGKMFLERVTRQFRFQPKVAPNGAHLLIKRQHCFN